MPEWGGLGRILVLLGLTLAGMGALVWLLEGTPLGRLPGDLVWRRGSFTLVVPLATSLLLSVILTVVLNLLFRR